MESFSFINVSDQQFQDALCAFVLAAGQKKVSTQHEKYVWTRQRAQAFQLIVSMLGIAACTPQYIMHFYPDKTATRYNISSRLYKVRNAVYRYRNCKNLYNWYVSGEIGEMWKVKDFPGFSEQDIRGKLAEYGNYTDQ